MYRVRDITFLTDVDVASEASVSKHAAASEAPAAEDPPGPLVPFRVPPMPKAVVSRQFVSLDFASSHVGAHHLPEWERQMLLGRLRKQAPVDVEAFQRRLGDAKTRNAPAYIQQVCEAAARRDQLRSTEVQAAFDREAERRGMILYKHQHLVGIQRTEQFFHRAKKWYTIVVCHAFISAITRERRVQNAMDTFRRALLPMVRRHLALQRRRAEAAELTRRHRRKIPFPTPQVIQSMYGTFFQGWPAALLEKLMERAKPCYVRKGSYLMHEGDVSRVMFIITTGVVSVILRKKGPDKRRTKDNSSGVFEIKAPCYVGEFALVCREPRSASIVCETDVGYWAVLPDDFEEVAKSLSDEVSQQQREATDARRRQNLKRFFPLSPDFLRGFVYFEKFSDECLARLIDKVEPIVLHKNDHLFLEGELDSCTYFVQDGLVVLRDRQGSESTVTKGCCIGVFESSCGVNEPKKASMISINNSDIWQLKRETLIEVGMCEPSALLHCRDAAKKSRAAQIVVDKSSLWCFKRDPYLMFCLHGGTLTRLFDAGTPTVFLNGERLAQIGQTLNAFVLIVNGTLDVTVAWDGVQTTFRVCVTAGACTDAALLQTCELFRGLSSVIGAYEFAASLSQYVCTVTSFGLTETVVVERAKVDAAVSTHLRNSMRTDARAKDAVRRAYKQQNSGVLYGEQHYSFIRHSKDAR